MSKAIKFKKDIYLDTSGIVHDSETVKSIIEQNQKSDNGYLKLLNGIIIQWGVVSYTGITETETKKTISFNMAFPNKCFNVQVTLSDAGYGVTRFTTSAGVPEINKSSFTANFKSTTDKSSSLSFKLYWFAIGY